MVPSIVFPGSTSEQLPIEVPPWAVPEILTIVEVSPGVRARSWAVGARRVQNSFLECQDPQ